MFLFLTYFSHLFDNKIISYAEVKQKIVRKVDFFYLKTFVNRNVCF